MIARCAALTVPLSALMLPVDCLELRIDGIGSPTQRAREEREDREKDRNSECSVEGNVGVLAGEDGRKSVKSTQWIMKGSKRLNRFLIHRFTFILSLLLVIFCPLFLLPIYPCDCILLYDTIYFFFLYIGFASTICETPTCDLSNLLR